MAHAVRYAALQIRLGRTAKEESLRARTGRGANGMCVGQFKQRLVLRAPSRGGCARLLALRCAARRRAAWQQFSPRLAGSRPFLIFALRHRLGGRRSRKIFPSTADRDITPRRSAMAAAVSPSAPEFAQHFHALAAPRFASHADSSAELRRVGAPQLSRIGSRGSHTRRPVAAALGCYRHRLCAIVTLTGTVKSPF